MTWLDPTKAFYTPPFGTYLDIAAGIGTPAAQHVPTAETAMQEQAREFITYSTGFINGAAGSGSLTESQFIDSLVAYAKTLTASEYAQFTCVGFDPEARGQFWANFVISQLKMIQFGVGSMSVFDVWQARNAS